MKAFDTKFVYEEARGRKTQNFGCTWVGLPGNARSLGHGRQQLLKSVWGHDLVKLANVKPL